MSKEKYTAAIDYLSSCSLGEVNLTIASMCILLEDQEKYAFFAKQSWFQSMIDNTVGATEDLKSAISNNRTKIIEYILAVLKGCIERDLISPQIMGNVDVVLCRCIKQQPKLASDIKPLSSAIKEKKSSLIVDAIIEKVSKDAPMVAVARIISLLGGDILADEKALAAIQAAMTQHGILNEEECSLHDYLLDILKMSDEYVGEIYIGLHTIKDNMIGILIERLIESYHVLPSMTKKLKNKETIINNTILAEELEPTITLKLNEIFDDLLQGKKAAIQSIGKIEQMSNTVDNDKDNKSEQDATDNKIQMYGWQFPVNTEAYSELDIIRAYRGMAYAASEEAKYLYNKCGSLKGVVGSLRKDLGKIFQRVASKSVKALGEAASIYSEDEDSFLDQTCKNSRTLEVMKQIEVKVLEFMGKKREAEAYRDARMDSRGRIVGGGFGVSGAIQGMAIAGAANLATGVAHSVFNMFEGMVVDSSIDSKMDDYYHHSDAKKKIADAVFFDIFNMSGFVLKKMGYKSLYYTEKERLESNRIFSALKDNKIPKIEYAKKNLVHILRTNPLDVAFFQFAFEKYGDEGLSEYAKILHYDNIADSIKGKGLYYSFADPFVMRNLTEYLAEFAPNTEMATRWLQFQTVSNNKVISKACETYAMLQPGEEAYFCHNASDGKESNYGLVITSAGLHYKEMTFSPDPDWPKDYQKEFIERNKKKALFIPFDYIQDVTIDGWIDKEFIISFSPSLMDGAEEINKITFRTPYEMELLYIIKTYIAAYKYMLGHSGIITKFHPENIVSSSQVETNNTGTAPLTNIRNESDSDTDARDEGAKKQLECNNEQNKDSRTNVHFAEYIVSLRQAFKNTDLGNLYFNVSFDPNDSAYDKMLKKFKNAIGSYARGARVRSHIPIVLYDNTLFGSADEGFLITNKNFYYSDGNKRIPLNEIYTITPIGKDSSHFLINEGRLTQTAIFLLGSSEETRNAVMGLLYKIKTDMEKYNLVEEVARKTAVSNPSSSQSSVPMEPSQTDRSSNAVSGGTGQMDTASAGNKLKLEDYISTLKQTFGDISSGYFYIPGEHNRDKKIDKKFSNAVKKYASEARNEFLIYCYDSTLFGSAEEGFIVTNKSIYAKGAFEKRKVLPLSEIKTITSNKEAYILINEGETTEMKLFVPGGASDDTHDSKIMALLYRVKVDMIKYELV